MPSENQSWRQQLSQVRERVAEAEKARETRKKFEKERSREALAERLKKETPSLILNEFNELKKRCQQVGKKLYPPAELRDLLKSLAEFGEKLRFYKECQREHGNIFSATMKQSINRLLASMGEIQHSIDKQLTQWKGVEQMLETTQFRPRQPADNPQLVGIAKSFNQQAYEMALSLPSDYFAVESHNFHVAQSHAGIYGYVKYWAQEQAIIFALVAPKEINFRKLVRGFLHTFFQRFPTGAKAIRVRLTGPQEFKFYQEFGFRRDPAATDGLLCFCPIDQLTTTV